MKEINVYVRGIPECCEVYSPDRIIREYLIVIEGNKKGILYNYDDKSIKIVDAKKELSSKVLPPFREVDRQDGNRIIRELKYLISTEKRTLRDEIKLMGEILKEVLEMEELLF